MVERQKASDGAPRLEALRDSDLLRGRSAPFSCQTLKQAAALRQVGPDVAGLLGGFCVTLGSSISTSDSLMLKFSHLNRPGRKT